MIFLSYASQDRERVLPFYDLLDTHGLDPWMDCKKLLGGQNWDYEIKTALDRSEIVVVFVSDNSVDKRGYAQREIKLALDKFEEKVVGDIYIIPVQLDAGEYPHLLKGIQFLRVADEEVNEKLLASIKSANHTAKAKAEAVQVKSEVRWTVTEAKSSYNGIPGYSTSINRITVSSAKYPNVSEISDHINGALSEYSMDARSSSLTPNPEHFNLMQSEWQRTDTFDAIFLSAQVVGRVLAVTYSLHWYRAGAAHPVHSPRTFNYLLEPVHFLGKISDLFSTDEALSVLRELTEVRLVEALYEEGVDDHSLDWIRTGTKDWKCFSNFALGEDGLNLQFSSYQVACYAAGMPSVLIPYSELTPYFNDTVLYALNLYRR